MISETIVYLKTTVPDNEHDRTIWKNLAESIILLSKVSLLVKKETIDEIIVLSNLFSIILENHMELYYEAKRIGK